MIDITKEKFLDFGYEDVVKKEHSNKLVQAIKKHKIISGLLISLIVLVTVNTILIYNFFKILISI